MSARLVRGHSPFSLSHFAARIWAAVTHRNVTAKMVNVPILIILAGCSTTPKPLPPGDVLANFALTLQGTRYRYGGTTRDGFDCSGLVFYAHQQLGLTVPRTAHDQAKQAEKVKRRKLERGDLVFFKIDSRKVDHVGIYIGEHRFVHAPGEGKAVTIDSLDDEFYADTFSSAGRFWDQAPR